MKNRMMNRSRRLCAGAGGMAAAAGIALSASTAQALVPPWQWQWAHGSAVSEENIHSMVQTSDGGYIAVGDRLGSAVGSTRDIMVIRTDADGSVLWERLIDGSGLDRAFSVVETADGGFAVAGDTDSPGAGFETFLLKLTPAGAVDWGRACQGNAGGPGPRNARVIQMPNGDLVVASRMTGFGIPGSQHPMLFRVTAAGAPVFAFAYVDTRYGPDEVGALLDVVARPTTAGGYNILAVGYTSPGAGATRQALAIETLPSGAPIFGSAYFQPALDTVLNSVTPAPGASSASRGGSPRPAGSRSPRWCAPTRCWGRCGGGRTRTCSCRRRRCGRWGWGAGPTRSSSAATPTTSKAW